MEMSGGMGFQRQGKFEILVGMWGGTTVHLCPSPPSHGGCQWIPAGSRDAFALPGHSWTCREAQCRCQKWLQVGRGEVRSAGCVFAAQGPKAQLPGLGTSLWGYTCCAEICTSLGSLAAPQGSTHHQAVDASLVSLTPAVKWCWRSFFAGEVGTKMGIRAAERFDNMVMRTIKHLREMDKLLFHHLQNLISLPAIPFCALRAMSGPYSSPLAESCAWPAPSALRAIVGRSRIGGFSLSPSMQWPASWQKKCQSTIIPRMNTLLDSLTALIWAFWGNLELFFFIFSKLSCVKT